MLKTGEHVEKNKTSVNDVCHDMLDPKQLTHVNCPLAKMQQENIWSVQITSLQFGRDLFKEHQIFHHLKTIVGLWMMVH